jgi:NADH:ubiquinone oxidoreductase subunit C
MPAIGFIKTVNAEAIDYSDLPVMKFADFRDAILDEVKAGARISAMPAYPVDGGYLRLVAVLSQPISGEILIGSCRINGSWPSITPACPALHWFEREIAEIHNITPHGHPWLKPIRFQPPHDIASKEYSLQEGTTKYFGLDGEESHEVAVGPVHAGVIEPGHFRFLCHGETVYHLEISLGYQHRGIELSLIHI